MKSSLFGAVCACVFIVSWQSSAQAASISGQGTWESTLLGRDIDGNLSTAEAYYDTALNITWLADTNYASTSGFDPDGEMTWAESQAWVDMLNATNLYGLNSWRLPGVADIAPDGCTHSFTGGTECGFNVITSTSEMAHLFYDTLGNAGRYNTDGTENPQTLPFGWLSNSGPFQNIQIGFGGSNPYYWTETLYAPNPDLYAWVFNFTEGNQGNNSLSDTYWSWLIIDGDPFTPTVPIPPALYLFSSGLIGLVGMARRKAVL